MADDDHTYEWADAWQALVYRHTPFKPVDDEDFQELIRQQGALERLFLDTPSLEPYYRECMGLAEAPLEIRADGATRHVVAMQMQLLEDVFFSLRLDQYANAPDNRGWMNLFRRWGASPTFLFHLRELETTFSKAVLSFFRHYIEGWPADMPVPHPWDVATASAGRAPYGGPTSASLRHSMRAQGPGVFLDPGRREAGRGQAPEEPVRKSQHGETGLIGETTPPGEGGEEES